MYFEELLGTLRYFWVLFLSEGRFNMFQNGQIQLEIRPEMHTHGLSAEDVKADVGEHTSDQ